MYLRSMHVLRNFLVLACLGWYSLLSCTSGSRPGITGKSFVDSTLSNRRFTQGDSLAFMHAIDSAFHALPEKTAGDEQERYKAYVDFWYHIAKDYNRALAYSDSLLAFMEENDVTGEAYIQAVFARGDIFLSLYRHDEAFTWYYNARQLVLKEKDTCDLSMYTSRLAAVHYRQKRYRDAADLYKQFVKERSYCTTDKLQRFRDIQGVYDNIGIAYTRMGWLDSADRYYEKALNFIDTEGKEFPGEEDFMLMAKAVVYGNQADVAIRRGNPELAKEQLKRSIAINMQPHRAPEDAGYSIIKLANIYLDQNQPDSVTRLIRAVDSIRRYSLDADLYGRYLRLRTRYAEATGHTAERYFFLDKQLKFYDSSSLGRDVGVSTDIGNSLDQIGRQYRLETANKRKNDYLVLAGVFLAMFFAIMILLWINYMRSIKSIRELNNLNKALASKNADLVGTLEKLEQMRRDKRQLMHVVAHDLRSPVGSITTLAKMIRSEQIEKEGVPEVLDMIIKAGSSAQVLINELLEERAKENEGKQERVDLAALLQYSANLLQYRAAEKDQRFQLQLINVDLFSDREKLLRIFYNLLDNAIKFSPHKAIIRLEMEKIADSIEVRVIDQGIGIPENMRSTLLNDISSFSRRGTLGETSFGLGLSIVSQLMREVEGEIGYTSVENEGTTFYLKFPLTPTGIN
jgi:two-component system sensor histidine kinase VicK